jgi:hypothetical protein
MAYQSMTDTESTAQEDTQRTPTPAPSVDAAPETGIPDRS